MKMRYFLIPVLMVVFSLSSGFAIAAEQEQSQAGEQKQQQVTEQKQQQVTEQKQQQVTEQKQQQVGKQEQQQEQEQMFGSQLMTPEERIEHRDKMRSLKTQEEREAFRLEHHNKMLERAKEKGATLPETPSPRGKRICPKGGMGPGGGGRR